MRSETLQKLMGRPLRDIYGRFVGSVVGLSFDTDGQPKSVGVDHGNGFFAEYPNSRIVFDNETLVVVPSWKVDTDKLRREIALTQKRAQALEELQKEGEVTQVAYDDLYSQYTNHIRELQEAYSALTGTLKHRIDEIETRREALEKFLGNMKVQYRTGEIDEATYKVAAQYVQTMMERDGREKEDILAILGSLGFPEGHAPTARAITVEAETEEVPSVTS